MHLVKKDQAEACMQNVSSLTSESEEKNGGIGLASLSDGLPEGLVRKATH